MKPSLEAIFDFYGLTILPNGHGSWAKAQCPMPDHEDANPSASVNTDEGIFRCHACGAHGDGYDIVEARENVDTGFAAVKRRTEAIVGPSDSSVSRGPVSGGGLLARPRGQRRSGTWTPPWSM